MKNAQFLRILPSGNRHLQTQWKSILRALLSESLDSSFPALYLTIIPRARVGYEVIDSQRGAKRRVGYNEVIDSQRWL